MKNTIAIEAARSANSVCYYYTGKVLEEKTIQIIIDAVNNEKPQYSKEYKKQVKKYKKYVESEG